MEKVKKAKAKARVDRICTVCGRRFAPNAVVLSRYPGEPTRMHKMLEFIEKRTTAPRPPEVECHRIWMPSWMDEEGLCGPLRPANAQDDFLDQLGVKE